MASHSPPTPPLRQIRAHRPSPATLTVYQAYNSTIAASAVSSQTLLSSPLFSRTRMTWIKPSWCWVNYRSGYTYKDANQARILAIEMTVEGFDELLSHAVLAHEAGSVKAGRDNEVRVQWDPERGPRMERLGYRSIQIGIPGALVERWANEWVVGIRDVTEMARGMKEAVGKDEKIGVEELGKMNLHPAETVYEVGSELTRILQMEG